MDICRLNFISFHISSIKQLISLLDLKKVWIVIGLPIYYLLTIVNALTEALSALLLVSLFTWIPSNSSVENMPVFVLNALQKLNITKIYPDGLYILAIVLGINLLIRLCLLSFDGLINALLRRRVQEKVFSHFLLGQWALTRDLRVGDAVGTTTQESLITAKYLTSAINAIYFAISAIVFLIMAAITNIKIMIFLSFFSLPLAFLMRKTFLMQTSFSKESARLRNNLSADIADRLNGLLQVHVDNNNYEYHVKCGLRSQDRLTRLDILIGYCQAAIASFNPLLSFLILFVLSIWIYFSGSTYNINLPLILSVGLLSRKAFDQLNAMVSSLGNLSRLSGSLFPVKDALNLPLIPSKKEIKETVIGVACKEIYFGYGKHNVLNGVNFNASAGFPLQLAGQSGKGKTSMANLIAGLCIPDSGKVIYQGASGKEYISSEHFAHIGFVTQDIYLFEGSLRSNLLSGKSHSDEEIWLILDQVGATEFVKNLGGLDINISEAGRSLSGGQRRRLGIARALISGCDILIFDEITSGLDKANKKAITDLIEKLSAIKVIIFISHEELNITNKIKYFL
jgi:ABC-type multidrug transport system fused ATPase/permease subunit